jgi:hypothetical protein
MKKIIIAHRANLDGISYKENTVESVAACLDKDLNVEIDVWYESATGFWLGHDKPIFNLYSDKELFLIDEIWCHAKNLEAALKLKEIGAHYFWHQEDDFALTSKGYFWTYPGKKLSENSIAVMPDYGYDEKTFHLACGICTDFPLRYID